MTNEQRMIVSALRAQGMGYGAIARKVGISENTVNPSAAGTHRKRISRSLVRVSIGACAVGRRSPSKLAGKKEVLL